MPLEYWYNLRIAIQLVYCENAFNDQNPMNLSPSPDQYYIWFIIAELVRVENSYAHRITTNLVFSSTSFQFTTSVWLKCFNSFLSVNSPSSERTIIILWSSHCLANLHFSNNAGMLQVYNTTTQQLICHVSWCLVILNRTNSVMCHSAPELEILSWHQ